MNTQIIYFQFKDFHVPFMTLQSIGFKLFAKIMKVSCVFCCSSCINFNPTSHLKGHRFCLTFTGITYCTFLNLWKSEVFHITRPFVYAIRILSNFVHVSRLESDGSLAIELFENNNTKLNCDKCHPNHTFQR